jgi:hypothetical protein
MARKQILIILLTIIMVHSAIAAEKDSTKVNLNHYSLAIGLGWAHYINTLEIGKEEATTNSAGVSMKFFWEPEHRLSLGLETGFYRLYSVKSKTYTDDHGKASMSVVPLLLTIRMRIIDQFYLSAGAGLGIMFNKITGFDNKLTNQILSMANFQASASYLYPLSKHWNVGGEIKVLTYGKTDDWMYTIQAVCAVKL